MYKYKLYVNDNGELSLCDNEKADQKMIIYSNCVSLPIMEKIKSLINDANFVLVIEKDQSWSVETMYEVYL